ncbi:hypothetical protein VPH35_040244 [Triticum aestivum]|uniref:NB-ARC domain-containing protein n=2 Tax=Aegilops tauschii subsp. strangulata TaxID=200361 RepID=A0A453D3X4_AEGTS
MQVGIANLCAGQETVVSELKQFSVDQTFYAFHDKGVQDRTYFPRRLLGSRLNTATAIANAPTCIKLMVAASEASHLVGREKDKSHIIKKLISYQGTQERQVISVWGMSGVGKTTLVKDRVNSTFYPIFVHL